MPHESVKRILHVCGKDSQTLVHLHPLKQIPNFDVGITIVTDSYLAKFSRGEQYGATIFSSIKYILDSLLSRIRIDSGANEGGKW
jgi:hypothetical protein